MTSNTTATTPLLLELDGLCGCGFRIEKRADRSVIITLRSADTEVIRRHQDVPPRASTRFFEFARSVAIAVQADAEEGGLRVNFVDPVLFCEELGLEMRIDLVDNLNDHLRAELILHAGDHRVARLLPCGRRGRPLVG